MSDFLNIFFFLIFFKILIVFKHSSSYRKSITLPPLIARDQSYAYSTDRTEHEFDITVVEHNIGIENHNQIMGSLRRFDPATQAPHASVPLTQLNPAPLKQNPRIIIFNI